MNAKVGKNLVLDFFFNIPLKEKKYELEITESGLVLNFDAFFLNSFGEGDRQSMRVRLNSVARVFRKEMKELKKYSKVSDYAIIPGYKAKLEYRHGKFYEVQTKD